MTKKEKMLLAAALSYKTTDSAPKVVALGKGAVAAKIIEKAKQHDVPTVMNEELAAALNMLNIGDDIPVELYRVVAQILAYVSDIDKMMKK